jgi:hypothetical protein
MRFRKLCLPWLLAGFLLAACGQNTIPLPEIITPDSLVPTEAPAITATPPPGGTLTTAPTPISTQIAIEVPEWCRDGFSVTEPSQERALFVGMVKDNDVWLWEEGQPNIQLTQHGDVGQVFLSDDGQVVVYTRPAERGMIELWKVDYLKRTPEALLTADDLGKMRRASGQIGVIPYNISWIPGTHTLAFNTYTVIRGEGIWIYIPDDVRTLDVDTKQLTTLFPVGSGGHFSYSPDGSYLALFTPDSFRVFRSDGKELLAILQDYRAIAFGEYYGYPWPQWSEDSQKLLVAVPAGTDPLSLDARVDIWEVRVDGSQAHLIRSIQSYQSEVVISPDLQKIAYWRQPNQRSSGRELRVMEVYGNQDDAFAEGNVMERFQWLPDSQRFLFWYSDSWHPWMGHLCQKANKFPGATIRSDIHWVDDFRYLYLSSLEHSWNLYLGDVNSRQILVEDLGESYSFAYTSVP